MQLSALNVVKCSSHAPHRRPVTDLSISVVLLTQELLVLHNACNMFASIGDNALIVSFYHSC